MLERVASTRESQQLLEVTYVDVFPGLNLLDPISNIPKARTGLLKEAVDSLSHPLSVALCPKKGDLVRQASDVRGQRE